jgi:hypothetical protein
MLSRIIADRRLEIRGAPAYSDAGESSRATHAEQAKIDEIRQTVPQDSRKNA